MTVQLDTRKMADRLAGSPGCPLCLSRNVQLWARARDVEYYTNAKWFDYYRCDSCDVLFLYPLPVDQLAEIYPPNYYAYSQARSSMVTKIKSFLDRRQLRRILRRIPGEQLSVLDIGGGAGEVLNQVRAADMRVKFTQIVDLDAGAEGAAQAAGHEYARCRIEDFRSSRSFDLILLLNLIEHVENPVAVLRKAGSFLAPQGWILIKTPNFDSFDARLFRHRSWGGYHCPRHWTMFTARSLRAAAKAAGLQVSRISYTQGAPFWAISVFELLREAGLVRASHSAPAPFHPIIPLLQGVFAAIDFVRSPFSRTSQMFIEMRVATNHVSRPNVEATEGLL
jgi:2-polyprenyl-3-methyl-5-hydroxy-6-metoxy-1,4-benzoquinol methylase